MSKILIIEDDSDLVHLMAHALYQAKYEVHYAFNGREGYDKILSILPDLILLDLMMPELSGTDVLKMMSENTTLRDIPVIVITAHSQDDGLLESSVKAQGARELIKKPFYLKELLARVRAVLKLNPAQRKNTPSHVAKGVIRLDPRLRTVWIEDRRIATLPPKRANVLQLLLQSKGIVSKEKLLERIWGKKGNENLLEKTISRLREDLGKEDSKRLVTHPGGYEIIG